MGVVISFAPANIPITAACTQLVATGGTTVVIQLNGFGNGSVPITIPPLIGFVGLTMFGQMIDLVHFCGSNGMEMRVGR